MASADDVVRETGWVFNTSPRARSEVVTVPAELTGGLPVLRVRPEEEERAKAILATHADKDWSLCDVISFAILESRGARMAFTFDRHFRQYGRFEILGLLP